MESISPTILVVITLLVICLSVFITYFFLRNKYAKAILLNEQYQLSQQKIEEEQNNRNNQLLQLQSEKQQLTSLLAVKESEANQFQERLNEVSQKNRVLDDKYAQLNQEAATFKNTAFHSQKRLEQLEQDFDELRTKYAEEIRKGVELSTLNHTLNEKIEKSSHELTQLQQQFKTEFENLANRIFEEKSSKFATQNKLNLDVILSPFKDQIDGFKKKIEDNYGKESNERHSLRTEIELLRKLNVKIAEDAQNLTKALKGDTKKQGDWGEMILDSVLRKSGLREGFEYLVQPSYNNENGERQRPDVVINYPGNKQVIVDSKVSLNAYDRYVSAVDREQQDRESALHVNAIKKHIDDLSFRDYQNLPAIKSLDYVLMFIPIEPAFLLALQQDETLWDYAYKKKVVIVGPTTLMSTLKVIEELWRNENQQQNIEEVIRQATAIYNKARGFVDTLLNLQRKIGGTKDDVDKAIKQLHTGKGNLIKLLSDMKLKGDIKTSQSIPEELEELSNKKGELT
ncbi:DNA recombination protein RmuC [Flammeovirga agarivorans]|uniref:DNA recombination protein RmuC n=1 Tax=Flammeovirga agarivorans TaxID=2726742 RepID=A0A7X8SI87_9BACT|nr:DNA recombination protein RmuC [Flammeovirga agarivorans]NLR90744.1 DNA recombination protein RmuC [Flammeovirga agarivorans]